MRIAVIEDEKPIREGLIRILQKMNPDMDIVGSAQNGLDGIQLVQEEKPELIFLDIQMPDMDGLQMLKELRKKKIEVKVIILTAYSDFGYAKEAISLGIENYLLKPVDLTELQKTLKKVKEELLIEQRGQESLTLEQLFTEILEGEKKLDTRLEEVLEETYGVSSSEQIGCLYISLGSFFEQDKSRVKHFLEEMAGHGHAAGMCWIERKAEKAILVCFYSISNMDKFRNYIKHSVFPACASGVREHGIFVWKECGGLQELVQAEKELKETESWNLIFGKNILIECDRIREIRTYRFAYPSEIESCARHAVICMDSAGFVKCFQQFMETCILQVHSPQDIREVCIRFAYSVINTAKECGTLKDDERMVQYVLKTILNAVRWEEIMDVMLELFSRIQSKKSEQPPSSTEMLVQKALSVIRESYSDAISLEQLSARLHVTETYLGKLLKRETGMSFTEILRKQRIDEVKRLLLDSDLKLTQIAAMTGFTDSKYMSKVFRGETGMLPNEYRRINT